MVSSAERVHSKWLRPQSESSEKILKFRMQIYFGVRSALCIRFARNECRERSERSSVGGGGVVVLGGIFLLFGQLNKASDSETPND